MRHDYFADSSPLLMLLSLLMVIACRDPLAAQSLPAGEDILRNIDKNFAELNDFTVSLRVKVDLQRLKVPIMNAVMYFKRPDKMHFQSDGFAILPKEGFAFIAGGIGSRFEVENVNLEEGRYVLLVRPKEDRSKLRRVLLKVDPTTWTVARVVTPQTDGRQMKAEFTYANVGRFRLPASLLVTFTTDSASQELPDPFANLPTIHRQPQTPRTGTISILFSDYILNSGLKDEVFNKQEPQK